MALSNRKYLLSSDGRVFIREKSECCPIPYEFYNCMRADGIQKSFGEPTSQFCPSPKRTGSYEEVAVIKAAPTRATTNLVGRIPLSYDSILYKLGKEKCEFDVQVHFGTCSELDNFAEFESAIVLENVRVTAYNTDQMGSLTPDENALVNETIALSVGNWYSIRKLNMTNIGINGPLVGAGKTFFNVHTCSAYGCVDCCVDDCLLIALVGNTVLDRQEVWVSKDVGNTWIGPNVIPLSNFFTAALLAESSIRSTSIACDKDDILIGSTINIPPGTQGFPRIWRISKQDLLDLTSNFSLVWQQNVVLTAVNNANLTEFKGRWYVNTTGSGAIGSSAGWAIREVLLNGTNGYPLIYDPNVHAASDRPHRSIWGLRSYKDEVMLVGVESLFAGTNQAYFAYSYDGVTWEQILMTYNGQPVLGQRTAPVPLGKNKWLISVTSPTLPPATYCTLDGGQTFTLIEQNVRGVTMHSWLNNNIAYGVTGSGLRNKFYRSYDLAASWRKMPEDGVTVLPNDVSNGENSYVAFCSKDPNQVILGNPSNLGVYGTGSIWRAD